MHEKRQPYGVNIRTLASSTRMSVPAGGPSRNTRANDGVVAQVRPTLAEISRQSVSLATMVDSCVNCDTPALSRRSVALTIGVTDAGVWSSTRTQNATDSVEPLVIRPVSVRAMPWLGSVRPEITHDETPPWAMGELLSVPTPETTVQPFVGDSSQSRFGPMAGPLVGNVPPRPASNPA